MSKEEHEYLPSLPYVLAHKTSGRVIGRFYSHNFAEESRLTRTGYEDRYEIIDTTPRVPDDVKYITWRDYQGCYGFAVRMDGGWTLGESDSQPINLEDLPGVTPETKFVPLYE